jgi:hypothetical protein
MYLMETYYALAAGLFLAIVVSLLVLVVLGLSQALARLGQKDSRLPLFAATGVLAWLALLAILAQSGFFARFEVLPPRFAFSVLPPVLFILYLAGSGRVSRLLTALPAGWLIGPQVFRVAVEVVLWLLFLEQRVPVQMTFEGLNYDILVGLTAPVVALYMTRNPDRKTVVGVVWNILGLALLLNIVIIAILSAPTPFRFFMNEPANTIIADWPFIWLPGFVVPMAFLLHVFSLKQLWARSRARKMTSPEKTIVI